MTRVLVPHPEVVLVAQGNLEYEAGFTQLPASA